MSVYVLVAILLKRLGLEHLSLWQTSQVLSLTRFEKTPLISLFSQDNFIPNDHQIGKHLSFLNF